jgi:peptidoglycan/LPS O-acetylase OafA/YrhL
VSATTLQSPPTEASFPGARHGYRPDIDGLRAIAILAVVLHHAGVPVITGGFTGVDIFFVISGYLIGGQIYAEIRDGSFTYLLFYQRRARRILPAFYAVLLFTFAAGLILLSPNELRFLARDAFAATLSASNISFWRLNNYFDPRNNLRPLLMTWSLGIEEQFYLVIPLFMALLARLRHRLVLPAIVIVCALSLLLAAHDVGFAPNQAFYRLSDRAWELGFGVALAVFELDRRPLRLPAPLTNLAAFAGLVLLLAPFFLLTPQTPFPGLAALPSVLGTAILIALPASFVNRSLLALAPLVFIGRVSYSWYLWHWPLLSFLHSATVDALPIPAALLAVSLAFILAVLSWRFIEQPFRHSATPPAPLLRRYAAASLALLAVCAALYVSRGLPQRYSDLAAIEAPTLALEADPCLASGQDKPNLSPACYPGAAADPAPNFAPQSSIAIWGDSHAAALAPGLRSLALQRGYQLAEFAKNSCTPLIGATHLIPRLPGLVGQCRRFNRATFSLIQSDPRIRIVVLAASWSAPFMRTSLDGWLAPDPALLLNPDSTLASPSSAEPIASSRPALSSLLDSSSLVPTAEANLRLYRSALDATVHALQATGKQVILVQDMPSFPVDPPVLVRTANIPARRALAFALAPSGHINTRELIDPGFLPPESSPAISASVDLIRQASERLDVQLFDPKPALCPTPTQCAYRDGDTLLFNDSTHVSAAGATRALADFPLAAAR